MSRNQSKPKRVLTAQERTEAMDRKMRALANKMKKEGKGIYGPGVYSVYSETDIQKTFKRLEGQKAEEALPPDNVMPIIKEIKR